MYAASKALAVSAIVVLLSIPTSGSGIKPGNSSPKTKAPSGEGTPVLWRDPGNIASRDLYYGPGSKLREPQGTFTFEREDLQGSSPKFDVVDQDGVKWRVKMGVEARPETAASRLVWAVGYGANEDYFVPVLQIQKMPHLHRGASLVSAGGIVRNVRLKRHQTGQKNLGYWSWADNPFKGTREWYGLQVLMAVINNWDLKDDNNSVYQVHGDAPQQLYLVSDLGASFGTTGLNWDSKGNLTAYRRSKLFGSVSQDFVNFNVPSAPALDHFFNVPETVRRLGLLWLGRHIPRADAKWMGHLLAQLSPAQIHDAFRSAGYSAAEAEGFSQVLTRRIHELDGL